MRMMVVQMKSAMELLMVAHRFGQVAVAVVHKLEMVARTLELLAVVVVARTLEQLVVVAVARKPELVAVVVVARTLERVAHTIVVVHKIEVACMECYPMWLVGTMLAFGQAVH